MKQLLCVLAAVLLTACGVQQTGVVEAGGPATANVYANAPGQRQLLFFLSPDGRVTPVVREAGTGDEPAAPVISFELIGALFAGPLANERAAGLRTGLPALTGAVRAEAGRDTVHLTFAFPVRTLKDNAVRQVVCTAAYSDGHDGGTTAVTITGSDGALPSALCGETR